MIQTNTKPTHQTKIDQTAALDGQLSVYHAPPIRQGDEKRLQDVSNATKELRERQKVKDAFTAAKLAGAPPLVEVDSDDVSSSALRHFNVMKALSSDTILEAIAALQITVNGLPTKTDFHALQTAVNGLESTVNGLESTVNGLESTVNGLPTKTEFDALQTTVNGLESTVKGLPTKTEFDALRNNHEVICFNLDARRFNGVQVKNNPFGGTFRKLKKSDEGRPLKIPLLGFNLLHADQLHVAEETIGQFGETPDFFPDTHAKLNTLTTFNVVS